MDGEDINAKSVDPVLLRAQVGMVFQKPNPFPKTIYENVAYGPQIHGLTTNKAELDGIVEASLKRAGLWDEVADRLHSPGTGLSGGQQQRLVIARAIAVEPEVILMDEPCSALDPIATAKIEELIDELRERYCIVIVTHSMAQAARVSQRTAFFHMGRLVETGDTEEIFTNPARAAHARLHHGTVRLMNQHTVKAYGDELNQLTAEVARMGGLAEAQVADAVESVARRDIALARAVVDRDAKLDAMHRDIEKKAIRLIALRQPVASRPAQDPVGDEAGGRSGTDRRPGQEHRQARA